jgi:hypothetical protein
MENELERLARSACKNGKDRGKPEIFFSFPWLDGSLKSCRFVNGAPGAVSQRNTPQAGREANAGVNCG